MEDGGWMDAVGEEYEEETMETFAQGGVGICRPVRAMWSASSSRWQREGGEGGPVV